MFFIGNSTKKKFKLTKTPIKEFDKHQIDKYLRTVETAGLDHYSICNKTKKEYFDRIKKY